MQENLCGTVHFNFLRLFGTGSPNVSSILEIIGITHTTWPEFASELQQHSDGRLSAK
jgi:hypothetical protein